MLTDLEKVVDTAFPAYASHHVHPCERASCKTTRDPFQLESGAGSPTYGCRSMQQHMQEPDLIKWRAS